MKLVHAADLHIDSPLQGLTKYAHAPADRIRGATRAALVNLVDLCIDEGAAALLLAGDIFDGGWKDYSTGIFFVSEMTRLRDAGVTVFSVQGNHDAANKMGRRLKLPDNVKEFATDAAKTITDDVLGLAVHGQGFAQRVVDEDLARGFPDAVAGLLNIGLLHTSLDGRPGHAPYAPTSTAVLTSKGYDYWALGHVHRREVIRRNPYIVYPGNLQGRHARETGAKGATVITVDRERLEVTDVSHRPLDVVRWAQVTVDASACPHPDDVLEAARGALEAATLEACQDGTPRSVCARVTIEGQSGAHDALHSEAERWLHELRVIGTDVEDCWVEKVLLKTTGPVDLEGLATQDDALGALFRRLGELQADPEALAAHAEDLREEMMKLPPEAREGLDGIRLDDPGYLKGALEDVTQLLIPRLLAGESDEP
ncbi:MAG: DNA repair exonuclease [Deltaproteobacteria bacterium]|nr:DNA repair exonuclease [Deltaproteobacteria bacterium]